MEARWQTTALISALAVSFTLFRVGNAVADPTNSATVEGFAAGVSDIFSDWGAVVDQARASQPAWSSPIATTTGLLEQRFRFDVSRQHSGNGTSTTLLDGGKGLDLILSDSDEI